MIPMIAGAPMRHAGENAKVVRRPASRPAAAAAGAGQPLSQSPTRRPTEIPPAVEPESVVLPTPEPFILPDSSSVEGQQWLIMLYQDADDKILEQDIYVDLNEAERAGSSERVHIVAQVDRYNAG